MGIPFSPGLMVSPGRILFRERKLPLPGTVLARVGDKVKAADIVARYEVPGNGIAINAANLLGCQPNEIGEFLRVKPGEAVRKGDILGETPGLLGFFKNQVESPVHSHLESISFLTGQVILREPPVPMLVTAFVEGTIVEVFPDRGVKIEAAAATIQGIYGVGFEAIAALDIVEEGDSGLIEAESISPQHAEKIIASRHGISLAGLRKAAEQKVKGIIVGSIDAKDLRDYLGGDPETMRMEYTGFPIILTEGFGALPMAECSFQLLQQHSGKTVAISGVTQIRAGVIRPEILIPIDEAVAKPETSPEPKSMRIGALVRIVRQPHFGKIAKIVYLPAEPDIILTETKVRVAEVQFLDGPEKFKIPRTNLEVIES